MSALCPKCTAEARQAEAFYAARKRGERVPAIIERVRELVRVAGPQGLTVEDLERLLKLPHQSVSARVHDLMRRGALRAAGKRKTRSGREATAWAIAPGVAS